MDDRHIDRAAFLKRTAGLLALALIDLRTIRPAGAVARTDLHHPDPRPGINADHVLTAEDLGDFAKKSRVTSAYNAARAYPEIFDGLSCGCGCVEHGGEHRSLLSCYESMQPTGCVACQEEATFVADLAKDKKTLAEIRTAVDKKFS
jgi:hypothetical protein